MKIDGEIVDDGKKLQPLRINFFKDYRIKKHVKEISYRGNFLKNKRIYLNNNFTNLSPVIYICIYITYASHCFGL